ncbi:hypothetical protein ACG7TL_004464 [Trametes sanguinea]
MHALDNPIEVYNADGTVNAGGRITHCVRVTVRIGDHQERMAFLVTDLGKSDIFLGHEWIQHHNPRIDWRAKTVEFTRCPSSCVRVLEEGERLYMLDTRSYLSERKEREEEPVRLRARSTRATEIAIENAQGHAERTFEQMVPTHYRDFADVFSEATFDELPEHRPYDHVIELTPGAQLYSGKLYPMSREQQAALDEFLEENLRTGRIRPSKSPWGAPFFFVKKKDGRLRPVQDYRKLNALTKKNKYPLPLISELLDRLKGAKVYTKMDIRWGYNNVRMREGDEEKAAFLTNRGLFEPLVMFFGLSNSPATFQLMMNDLFRDLILKGKVIVYLDDILVFTETLEEHRHVVRQVLQILREQKLSCKPEKCEFEVAETEYLGHIIGAGIVKMDPAKVAGVAEWPVPTTKKELQSFLGFANFYRRFVEGFAKIATPLHRLTGQTEWRWQTEQQDAFERLKTAITSAPVLAIPNDDDPFRVQCDASDYAIGAELSQKQDGKWRPIAFLSKALTPAERNYQIWDRELLAVIASLDEWRHFLVGARHTFEIHSDHKNLEYFRQPQRLNARQARWVVELQNFDFTLIHRPGKSMGKADALSRRADHADGEMGEERVMVLKEEWFRALVDGTEQLRERIRNATEPMDNSVRNKLAVKDPDYEQTEDGLIWRRGRVVVPANKELRGRVIASHHDSITAGHPGRAKTQELIQRSYWWPSIRRDVQAYVKGCAICQRTKIDHRPRAAPLHPNPIANWNWEHISVDLITGLPECQGYDAILMVCCMKSKDYIPIPCRKDLTAEGYANLLVRHVVALHGLPKRITSDRGQQFSAQLTADLYYKLGIERNLSTAYHPQTDGQTERLNQEIENYLRIFVNYRQSDWVGWLALAAYSYRIREHSATGFSPFYMTHGRHPYTGVETAGPVKTESVSQFVARMEEIQREASAAIKIAQEAMKRSYDRKRGPAREYRAGDWVYLEAYNIHTERPTKKMEDRRYGPFRVAELVGKSAYRLDLPPKWKRIHPVFNEVLLTPAHAPAFPNQVRDLPIPDLVAPEAEPEEILDSKFQSGTVVYYVKWKNRARAEATWEPRTPELAPLITAFHRRFPTAPRMPFIRIPPVPRASE